MTEESSDEEPAEELYKYYSIGISSVPGIVSVVTVRP